MRAADRLWLGAYTLFLCPPSRQLPPPIRGLGGGPILRVNMGFAVLSAHRLENRMRPIGPGNAPWCGGEGGCSFAVWWPGLAVATPFKVCARGEGEVLPGHGRRRWPPRPPAAAGQRRPPHLGSPAGQGERGNPQGGMMVAPGGNINGVVDVRVRRRAQGMMSRRCAPMNHTALRRAAHRGARHCTTPRQ